MSRWRVPKAGDHTVISNPKRVPFWITGILQFGYPWRLGKAQKNNRNTRPPAAKFHHSSQCPGRPIHAPFGVALCHFCSKAQIGSGKLTAGAKKNGKGRHPNKQTGGALKMPGRTERRKKQGPMAIQPTNMNECRLPKGWHEASDGTRSSDDNHVILVRMRKWHPPARLVDPSPSYKRKREAGRSAPSW